MSDYRAYIFTPDGRFVGLHNIAASDRRHAVKVALGLSDGHAIELWEGADCIGTFRPNENLTDLGC